MGLTRRQFLTLAVGLAVLAPSTAWGARRIGDYRARYTYRYPRYETRGRR